MATQNLYDAGTSVPSRKGPLGFLMGAAVVTVGLMAGLFYAYSISVMLGLAKTDDRTFVDVMQKLNQAIQNVAFGPVFVGAFAFTGAAAFYQHRLGARNVVRWLLASLGLYAASLAITMGVNIPLNEKLRVAGDVDKIADLHGLRQSFETPWVIGNAFRTILGTAALAALGQALVLHGREAARREAADAAATQAAIPMR